MYSTNSYLYECITVRPFLISLDLPLLVVYAAHMVCEFGGAAMTQVTFFARMESSVRLCVQLQATLRREALLAFVALQRLRAMIKNMNSVVRPLHEAFATNVAVPLLRAMNAFGMRFHSLLTVELCVATIAGNHLLSVPALAMFAQVF